jgi:hypothetical protein
MKRQLRTALLALAYTAATCSISIAAGFFNPPATEFTTESVSGKTMVSSGYPNGSMTFNSNGSLTCTNYPAFVSCKNWKIQDGTLRREFIDSHTGSPVEVVAFWKLLSRSDNTLQVQQTSNNSTGATTVTVTIQ